MILALFQPAQKKSYLDTPAFRIICLVFAVAWCWFFVTAKDRTDWWIENILVILFFIGLFISRKKIILSETSLVFIFLFLLLHIYGARMAYTQNELGEFLQNSFSLRRNPYDRVVHFSFGFLLLYPFVDLLSGSLGRNKNFILILANMSIFCLATLFELIEWGVAAFTDKVTGETYVATQGDPWDAQKDIALAWAGSILFTIILKMFKKNNVLNFPHNNRDK